MTPKLCKAGQQLREQIDDAFPDRDRSSDGWIADARHVAAGKSDHIPSKGIVYAIDVDRDLAGKSGKPDLMPYLADQIRKAAKTDKRIKYVILGFRWRTYKGSNAHRHHCHISFTTKGETDGSFFNIPMIGGTE
jgi:hypothetical protein